MFPVITSSAVEPSTRRKISKAAPDTPISNPMLRRVPTGSRRNIQAKTGIMIGVASWIREACVA